MEQIKAYVAEHEIAKTLIDALHVTLVFGVCVGTAPALIWLASYN